MSSEPREVAEAAPRLNLRPWPRTQEPLSPQRAAQKVAGADRGATPGEARSCPDAIRPCFQAIATSASRPSQPRPPSEKLSRCRQLNDVPACCRRPCARIPQGRLHASSFSPAARTSRSRSRRGGASSRRGSGVKAKPTRFPLLPLSRRSRRSGGLLGAAYREPYAPGPLGPAGGVEPPQARLRGACPPLGVTGEEDRAGIEPATSCVRNRRSSQAELSALKSPRSRWALRDKRAGPIRAGFTSPPQELPAGRTVPNYGGRVKCPTR